MQIFVFCKKSGLYFLLNTFRYKLFNQALYFKPAKKDIYLQYLQI